jgi:hypothetical protein
MAAATTTSGAFPVIPMSLHYDRGPLGGFQRDFKADITLAGAAKAAYLYVKTHFFKDDPSFSPERIKVGIWFYNPHTMEDLLMGRASSADRMEVLFKDTYAVWQSDERRLTDVMAAKGFSRVMVRVIDRDET